MMQSDSIPEATVVSELILHTGAFNLRFKSIEKQPSNVEINISYAANVNRVFENLVHVTLFSAIPMKNTVS
jgi:hypothetical protein